MFKTLANVFRVPELRNKVLFTLLMLVIYRIGFHVPLPGVDQAQLAEQANPGWKDLQKSRQEESQKQQALENLQKKLGTSDPRDRRLFSAQAELTSAQDERAKAEASYKSKQQGNEGSTGERLATYVSLFSGGNLTQSTIFGLGIMPYISASIILQLLTTVMPSLEKLQKEGETGRKKIQEWTRYITVPLCVVQAVFWLVYMRSSSPPLVQPEFLHDRVFSFWVMGVFALTAGCIFLMWLGEQIDEYGLGNGISLIILAGIVARMPAAVVSLREDLRVGAEASGASNVGKIIFLLLSFIFVVAGSILITQAQRRIPIQQAKHTRGRKIYGGQRQYLPLRVNHGGVMPIIFAQSLMLFPTFILNAIKGVFPGSVMVGFLSGEFHRGGYLYILTEVVMIYFFAYFWTTVQFQPKEMATQLRDFGSFIPGLRPGRRTSEYLEKVMMRITYVGGAFLCIIAVVPTAVSISMGVNPMVTQFLGGTGLLIVVSVALDMVQRIEANLLMRNYGGFLSGPGQKGKRIKGRQY